MKKPAPADHPLHPLLTDRWSPYWFDDRLLAPEDIRALLEAARWAPSAFNEQPWAFLIATRDRPEAFGRMLACLVEGNQTWARSAAALLIGLTRRTLSRNGQPNPTCEHDLGLAAAFLTFEASARGIFVHQMSGIVPERVRSTYGVPQTHSPLTALALGYCAVPDAVPERYRDRQLRPRERRPLDTFVFDTRWEQAAVQVCERS